MTNIGIVASIVSWHCHNVIHDKTLKLLQFSLTWHPIHPGIQKDPYIGAGGNGVIANTKFLQSESYVKMPVST